MKLEMKFCRRIAFYLMVSVFVAFLLAPVCSAMGATEAGDVIGQAELDLSSAYVVVAEAESAGGNVSLLVAKLNSAGDFLARAHVAFRAGDYENASFFALECSRALDGVIGDAAILKIKAEEARRDRVFWTAALSGIGLGFFLVLGLVGWRFLKKRYIRRILDLKPEVGEGL